MASLTRFPHQLVSSLLTTIYLWPTSQSHLGSTKDFYVSPQLRNFPWLVLTGAIKLLDLPFKVVTYPLRALSLYVPPPFFEVGANLLPNNAN